ncbi:MAG: hypothetical protein AABZ39_16060 [Spirochaetota bacterium]
MKESDWKYISSISKELVKRTYGVSIDKISEIIENNNTDSTDKYKKIHKEINKTNKIIDLCFNDWRRSQFTRIVLQLKYNNIIDENEYNQLSEEMKNRINKIIEE